MIGETLRKERERQKLTVHDIEQGTSIRSVYIEALENGDYDKLPGEVYAKGFVKNYANFLNLNGEKLVREFVAEISPPVSEVTEVTASAAEKIVEETPKTGKTRITDLQETNVKVSRRRGGGSSSNMWIVAAVVIIALLAGGFWYSLQDSAGGGEIAKVDSPPQQTEVTPPAENPSVTSPVSAAVPQDGVDVQARFSGDCWTRVMIDGVFVYEGVLNAGQTLDWHGAEGVTIRVGNAGAVEIFMNGQSFGRLGADGEVVERTFLRNTP